MKKFYPLIVFGLLHIVILFLLFYLEVDPKGLSTDVQYYFDSATKMVHGQLPFRDFGIEYPPLALFVVYLPRLFTSLSAFYAGLFALEMVMIDLVGLVFVAALARRLHLNEWLSLGVSTVALLATGPIILQRYDILPAVMSLAAVYFFIVGKHKTAWVMVALGTLTKLYPAVLAPVFLIVHLQQNEGRKAISGIAAAIIAASVVVVPCLFLSPAGFLQIFTFHLGRGLQVESTYASILLFGQTLGLTTVRLGSGFGSVNIQTPVASTLATISLPVMVIVLLLGYWYCWRRQGKTAEPGVIISGALLAIIGFMAAGKVLSPQYIVWIYPFVPLVLGKWRHTSWGFFIIIALLTRYVFPNHYNELVWADNAVVVDILLWRNLLLVAWWCLLLGEKAVLPPRPDGVQEVVP